MGKKKKEEFSTGKKYKRDQREIQKEEGYFDGRFAPKVQKSKKSYSRKGKNKNWKNQDDVD